MRRPPRQTFHTPPANLPAEAVGFIAPRDMGADHWVRFRAAVWHRDGNLSNTGGVWPDEACDLRVAAEQHYRVTPEGFLMPRNMENEHDEPTNPSL